MIVMVMVIVIVMARVMAMPFRIANPWRRSMSSLTFESEANPTRSVWRRCCDMIGPYP